MAKTISQEWMKTFEPSEKIGLISTVTGEGLPHITLITTLQANTPSQLIWGQFIEGMSKENVRNNPKTGFLIMTMERAFWTGRALWTHEKHEGPEYVMYNDKPLYRYNTYTGIHTVHYMDLVEISEKLSLDMPSIAGGAVLAKIAKGGLAQKTEPKILNLWSEKLFNKIDALKFISFVDQDGYPVILPIIQAQAAGSAKIVFTPEPYAGKMLNISRGTPVAVFGMNFGLESVLAEGEFKGFRKSRGVNLGVVDIGRVYNSMPPKQGYIYPERKPEPVRDFGDASA